MWLRAMLRCQQRLSNGLAHANCTPFFSPKHLDLVTEKYSFFAILKIPFFKPSQKRIFHQFCPFSAVFRGVK